MAFNLSLPPIWHGHSLPLHALLEAAAYALGYQAYRWKKSKQGDFLPSAQRLQLVVAAIIGALIGSKIPGLIQHIFHPLPDSPWLASKTVAGGLLGGWAAVEALKKNLSIQRATGGLFVYPVILGMFIGRLGCFLAGPGDGTWGKPTSFIMGINTGDGLYRHPAPLYEMVFLVLLSFGLKRLSLAYTQLNTYRFFLIAYLIFRLWIDGVKEDPILALGLTSIQWFCIGGILFLLWDYRNLKDKTEKTCKELT
jgi:phosphatidylglycerol---prolipoprotein diacylglyceryl transferase